MSVPNFLGFEPADRDKNMKILNDVIRLKAKNKDAAEKSRGFEIEAARENEKRSAPFKDIVEKQNALMLSYNSAKDIVDAKQELAQARQLKVAADNAADLSGDQGDIELASAYGYQVLYAEMKVKLLETMRDLAAAKTAKEKVDRSAAVERQMVEFQSALDNFSSIEIPVGFKQTVDIKTLPPTQNDLMLTQGYEQTFDEIISLMFQTQTPKYRMELDGIIPNVVFFVAPPTNPPDQPIVMRDISGNNPINGTMAQVSKDDPTSVYIFTNANGETFTIKAAYLNQIIRIPWDKLPTTPLIGLIFLYTTMYHGSAALKSSDYPTKLGIYNLISANPNYADALAELDKARKPSASKPKGAKVKGKGVDGEGIIQDVLGLIRTPKKQVRGPPRFKLGPSGEYGNVRVDMPALLNRGRVRVMRGGSVVLDEVEENVDGFGLSRLITKRVMQKTIDAAPPKVRKQYERLNKLAAAAAEISKNATETKGSGIQSKIKVVKKPENIVVVGNGAELAQRLKIATGLYVAGNRSSENVQLITELAHAMLKMGKISHERYADILDTYVAE